MDLEKLKQEFEKDLSLIKEKKDLENIRTKYLGRKSDLSLFFESLKNLPVEEKKEKAKKAQSLREFIFESIRKKEALFKETLKEEILDISQPGILKETGHFHPLTLVLNEIIEAFQKLGFEVVEGPEIETEYYNFDALRIPKEHPARDMWDTLWINSKFQIPNSKLLLRTHTSPMQIRYMETHQPPFRIIVPGKTFRHEATDLSHDIQFHQVEGLMVSKEISFSNFKSIVEDFLKVIFKNEVNIRFRPSYFPFVTPGVEVDIKLKSKENKWLEVMGAGMVHPQLYEIVGYKEKGLQGFAFGLGVERIAMIKYKINDIRLFTSSDIRFLKQF
jgi:phenylalanyl-tRNA synthetase alpha chain